jgi:hypothetical protein
MARTQLPDLNPGAEVMTTDGAKLGVVADVSDLSFKVDVRMAPDYWLGRDYVAEATRDHVSMSFPKSDLKAYKQQPPGAITAKDPNEESLADQVLPEDEQAEQRRRMEEELERQRRGNR